MLKHAGEQVEIWEQYFIEKPVFEDQVTRLLHSSNLNLLHLSRRLDDSLNVLNMFLSRCEELNIQQTLTTKVRRLLEDIYSIHTHIPNILTTEYEFVSNSNHPCFLS